jgi:hypothetical protein
MRQDGFNSIQIMISKIISRAASLTELTSNPKSFSNCPDLHGGVPGLPGDRIYMKPAVDEEKVVPLAIAPIVICEQHGDAQRAQDSGRL